MSLRPSAPAPGGARTTHVPAEHELRHLGEALRGAENLAEIADLGDIRRGLRRYRERVADCLSALPGLDAEQRAAGAAHERRRADEAAGVGS